MQVTIPQSGSVSDARKADLFLLKLPTESLVLQTRCCRCSRAAAGCGERRNRTVHREHALENQGHRHAVRAVPWSGGSRVLRMEDPVLALTSEQISARTSKRTRTHTHTHTKRKLLSFEVNPNPIPGPNNPCPTTRSCRCTTTKAFLLWKSKCPCTLDPSSSSDFPWMEGFSCFVHIFHTCSFT